MKIYYLIRNHLDDLKIKYKYLEHEPTPTSEDSARVRQEPIEIGGKSLVLKIGSTFKLIVLSGAHKIDSSKLKNVFKVKKFRFASKEELLELTGLTPGSVPPFGEPILPLTLYVDNFILKNTRIAFNAGSVRHSIILNIKDYMNAANIKEGVDISKKAYE